MFSPALLAYLADRAAFCYAMQDILQSVGGFEKVRLPGDQSTLPDDTIAVDFLRGAATGDRALRPALDDGTRQEYSIFSGTLRIVRGLLRASNTPSRLAGCITRLDDDEATIRACFLRSQHYFTVGRLANFVVNDIIEADAPEYGVDRTGDRERDVVILRFRLQYERVMANFPAA